MTVRIRAPFSPAPKNAIVLEPSPSDPPEGWVRERRPTSGFEAAWQVRGEASADAIPPDHAWVAAVSRGVQTCVVKGCFLDNGREGLFFAYPVRNPEVRYLLQYSP